MSRTSPLIASLAAAALVIVPTLPGRAADWEAELSDQAMDDFQCKVAFFSQVAEREVDGNRVIIAKVHCEDKRTFDAYRGSDFESFVLSPCEDPALRTC